MLGRRLSRYLDRRGRLRLLLATFFVALAAPTLVLVYQAWVQLKWQAFHQHRQMAEELAARIDASLVRLIVAEEARSFSDYSFLIVAGDPRANFLQRSPLAEFPVASNVPGLIGYFQVDAEGRFTTPLLPPPGSAPADYGIAPAEYAARLALEQQLQRVLSDNRLVRASPEAGVIAPQLRLKANAAGRTGDAFGTLASAPAADEQDAAAREQGARSGSAAAPEGQALFDKLEQNADDRSLGRPTGKPDAVEALELERNLEAKSRGVERAARATAAPEPAASVPVQRQKRKEQSVLPEARPVRDAPAEEVGFERRSDIRVRTFESEIDPFDFSLLDDDHFVLFRKVWRDGQRQIQGAVIDRRAFVDGAIAAVFRDAALAQMSDLIVAWRGSVLDAIRPGATAAYLDSTADFAGELLYQARLSAPLDDLELLFAITRLPPAPGSTLIGWLSVILMAVLCGGFLLMYRFGLGQIRLARQQQDFVSAVSHELRTPLTSIRMYGEMLRAGWVDEQKKKTYYDYIYDESERLSRLIANVLQLARMTRNDLQLDPRPASAGELMDMVRSKIVSQVERAGFACELAVDPDAAQAVLSVDSDCFAQIVINLVDNAIKFSVHAERKEIEIGCRLQGDGRVLFTVRDFGPGVPKGQMKKIFRLFYRPQGELTRETVGTGIGLALVHQLTVAMGGQVDVRNCDPGAEFRVLLAATRGAPPAA